MDSLQMLAHGYPATLVLEADTPMAIPTILKHTCTTGAVYEHQGDQQLLTVAPTAGEHAPTLLLIPAGRNTTAPEAPLPSLTIQLVPSGRGGVLPASQIALLVMGETAAHVFWHPPPQANGCTETVLSYAVVKSAQQHPDIAQQIVHRLAENPWARLHRPECERALAHLQREYPTDTTLATLIVQYYGAQAARYPGGARALASLQRYGSERDQEFIAAHDATRTLHPGAAHELARAQPAKFAPLVIERCVNKHLYREALALANEVLPSALPGRHTRTLLERARDCALHLGHFACAHTHAVAALHHTLAIQPDDVRARETAIDRAFETALYAHGDMPTALASLGIAQQDQLLHYVTTTPEHQYLSMGDRAALEAASELVPERQSLQRVMFLSQCEQRLFEPGCWDNQLRNRAYSLPPHDGEWLFADVRETNTLFATPQPSTFLSQATALRGAAHLLATADQEAFRAHHLAALLHLRGWSPLGAMLTGGFTPSTVHHHQAWFSPSAVLQLQLFGTPSAWFAGREVHLTHSDFELLTFLTLHPEGVSEQQVMRGLYRNNVAESVVRTRLVGLASLLDQRGGSYRLGCVCITDYHEFLHAGALGLVEQMRSVHHAPLFAGSSAPFIVRLRQRANAALAQAEAQQRKRFSGMRTWPDPQAGATPDPAT